MGGLFGDTIGAVEAALRFRVARQGVLASNVANADTPGYRRADIAFDKALRAATPAVARRHPNHLAQETGDPRWRPVVERRTPGPNGNDVDAHGELIRLSRNAGAFNEQAEVMVRLLELRRTAISSRR